MFVTQNINRPMFTFDRHLDGDYSEILLVLMAFMCLIGEEFFIFRRQYFAFVKKSCYFLATHIIYVTSIEIKQ